MLIWEDVSYPAFRTRNVFANRPSIGERNG